MNPKEVKQSESQKTMAELFGIDINALKAREHIVKKRIYGTREYRDLRIRQFPDNAPKLFTELLRSELKFIKDHADLIGTVQVKHNKILGYYEIHYYMEEV